MSRRASRRPRLVPTGRLERSSKFGSSKLGTAEAWYSCRQRPTRSKVVSIPITAVLSNATTPSGAVIRCQAPFALFAALLGALEGFSQTDSGTTSRRRTLILAFSLASIARRYLLSRSTSPAARANAT